MPIGARPSARELRVHEAHVELGVVNDEPRIADESQKIVDDASEDRLVLEQFAPYGRGRERRPGERRARG